MNQRPAGGNIPVGRRVLLAVALLLTLRAPGAVGPPMPLTPLESLRSFQFADPDLAAELVASEPDVVSPVAMAWDEAGRLYVAEMRDYPNATEGGAIRRLEDRDGDGRYETSVVFADQLKFPNSVLPWDGGVLVTAAPDLLFLRDTNGDGRADERRVWFTGFGTGNQQLRANGLTWGSDGWIYGANGRSDGQVRGPEATRTVSLRGRDFRFRPSTGEFESLAGRSQFGLALDDWGRRFLSWNTIPARHEVLPDRFLAGNDFVAGREVLVDLLPADDRGEVFPLTPAPRVFNSESSSHFNALSGLTIFRGNTLGPDYYGNLFVGESLRNLIHRRVLEPAGATFVARRVESSTEFLRSRDPWFHPVNFATGPDGALYVADFHREFVEHPDFVPREMRERVAWRAGRDQGRLWRVGPRRSPSVRPRAVPNLGAWGVAALVERLGTTNAWERDTAQRLLIERRRPETVPLLRQLLRGPAPAEGRFLALRTLAVFGALDPETLGLVLKDPAAGLRAGALEWMAEIDPARPNPLRVPAPLVSAVLAAAEDPDAAVRLRAALALSFVRDDQRQEPALKKLRELDPDRWVRLAAVASSRSLTREQVARLLPTPAAPLRPAPVPASPDPDRQRVVEKFTPALRLAGNRPRGASSFARLCLPCHYLQGHGVRVGPDLSGLAARPVEALLVDVLDPSRQVAPEFAAYEAVLDDGESVTGLYASESETRLTIRRPGAPDANFSRTQIRSLRSTGKSLMPEGLEQGMEVQDLADLLAFLRDPDGALLQP